MIVIDASAAIRWFKSASPAEQPYGLPQTEEALVAPDLFIAEVRSAVLLYVRKKELKLDHAKEIVKTIDRLMAGYVPIEELRDAAWEMALAFDHSPYDCFYVELARTLDTYVLTADERLLRKFHKSAYARHLMHLRDWHP